MNYSKIQKFISSFIIFTLIFSITFRVPFSGIFSMAEAKNKDFYNIVSLIVKEDIYNKIKSKLDRYSSDLQNVLENTKVIILPVPNNASPFSISSLEENLYLEWYAWLDKTISFESRLIWTVLVWDINLPVVQDWTSMIKSIAPYTDFVDKAYIYDKNTETYKKNEEAKDSFKSEIWHWVISPNTWDKDEDIKQLKNYFDKNHDFYKATWDFETSKTVLNWNKKEWVPWDYKPYVFYFDEFREEKSINYSSYKAYNAYLENREDLTYNRFSKELANKIKDEVLWSQNEELKALASKIDDKELQKAFENVSWPDLQATSDIATKTISQKTIKNFLGIFNSGFLSDMRTNIHNAWRYNDTNSKVNVDFIPYFISILDLVSDEVLKSTNTDLETQVDNIIKKDLAKNIKIPNSFSNWNSEYTHYFAWKKASDLKNPWDCTIYRGSTYNSWTLVEANRWLNINKENIESDTKAWVKCSWNPVWLYAWSSPANIDTSKISLWDISLKDHDNNKSVLPLFDILWSKKTIDQSKNPSPKNCLESNFIKTYEYYNNYFSYWEYDVLDQHNRYRWNNWSNCTVNTNLSWYDKTKVSWYTTISSFMEHKSPTTNELRAESTNLITQNLPIDKDRYVDFFAWENWTSYKKILYPNLFRIESASKIEIEKQLDSLLVAKNKELSNKINLISYLKNKPYKDVDISWETKRVSYYDFLVFSILWKNMTNISAKYKFVIENYLNDQIWWNDFDFILAKNKKQYEISYLTAPWDARNMYIKIEPEDKNTNPYADILAKNAVLDSNILSTKILKADMNIKNEKVFNCSPPDWVSLMEWFPAIQCRLKDMLPVKISFWENWCAWENLFITDEDKKKYEKRNKCEIWDIDRNWISDCLQDKLKTAKLLLTTKQNKYFYNTSNIIDIELRDKNNNPIIIDNSSYVSISIDKIVDKINWETIFDSSKDDIRQKSEIISNYISFTQTNLRLVSWKTKAYFSSKSKDVDIYFKASIFQEDSSKKSIVSLDSNILQVPIRGEHLFISSSSLNDNTKTLENTSTFVSDKPNIYIYDDSKKKVSDAEKISLDPKLVFAISNISKTWDKKKLELPFDIKIKNESWDVIKNVSVDKLDTFTSIDSISKSWNYTLNITDNYGFNASSKFEIIADVPAKIDLRLWSSILDINQTISTNIASIYDKFNNPVVWQNYDLKLKILWDSVLFEQNKEKQLNLSMFSSFAPFRLISSNVWNSRIEADLYDIDKKILTKSINIRVIEDLKLDVKLDKNLQVWNKTWEFTIKALDKNWNLLTDLDSRVYLTVDKKYGTTIKSYYEFKSWIAKIDFTTNILAWEKIPFSFLIEWFNQNNIQLVNILPEKAIKVDLSTSSEKIQADISSSVSIKASMKDIYWNTVFTDNKTTLNLEVPKRYSHIIKANSKLKTVSSWIAKFDLQATQNPWTAYILVSSNPKIETNQTKIKLNNWEDFIISWVSKNAIKIQTYYFYNKTSLEKSKYNALYTTLLWADYWNITKQDYLASSILFSPNSKALTVSSLLNNPYKQNNIFEISNSGKVSKIVNNSDLSQNLEISFKNDNSKTAIELYNSVNKTNIWSIFFNLSKQTNLEVCQDLSCIEKIKDTSIFSFETSFNYKVEKSDDKIILKDNLWEIIFSVNKTWIITKKENLRLEIEYNSLIDAFVFNIIDSNSKIINKIWFYFDWKNPIKQINNQANLSHILTTTKDNIVIYINNNSYFTWDSNLKKTIYYKDPFWDETSRNSFAQDDFYSFENSYSQEWIWWKDWNKSLLLFSSWLSVWEATKSYASLSLINLWDPVVSLKTLQKKLPTTNKNRQFDSSIWQKLNSFSIDNYKVFDYNDDNKDDILLLWKDKSFSLLEWKDIDWNFLNQRHLVYISDIWNTELVQIGDFSWDNYDDIFFVANDWKWYLLNNNKKDFTRLSLNLGSSKISKTQVFDMDNDNKDDIIVLDDSWDISIFYGWWNSEKLVFTQKKIYSWSWIKLSNETKNDMWALYYEWIIDFKSGKKSSEIDENLLNNIIFEKLPYSKNTNQSEQIEQKTFIRTQYSENVWLKLERTFDDVNKWELKSWDKVKVKLILKNISSKNIKDIAFVEDINDFFEIDTASIKNTKDLKNKPWLWTYDFLLDDFSLWANESIEINYELKTRNLSFWYLQAWLFEKDEAWDDSFWDVILKASEANCSSEVDIIRSTWKRAYTFWKQAPTCDSNKMKLPNEITRNSVDNDKNWYPDYIDEAKSSIGNLSSFVSGIKDSLFKDRDKDWNMDSDDFSPNFWDDHNFWDNLESINISVDKISEWVDNIVEGFGCWFWWWACISSPLNWAPLAPWNDPVFMWKLIWDGLKVDEWIPFFSALTWLNIPTPSGCFQAPVIWPLSPFKYTWSCNTDVQAWGYLWTKSDTNFVRLFYSPTITWANWFAACFWAPASTVWKIPWKWLSPFVSGWNCIVTAKPMDFCNAKNKQNWDPRSVWWVSYIWWNTWFWVVNANCEQLTNWRISTSTSKLDSSFVKSYFDYKNTWNKQNNFTNEYSNSIANYNKLLNSWPVVSYDWWNSWLWGSSVSLNISSAKNWKYKDVVQVKNQRTASFPSFLMEWVNWQLEEIITKLTDLPTLFIILPDFWALYNGDWDEYISTDWLVNSYKKWTDLQEKKDLEIDAKINKIRESINKNPSSKIISEAKILDLELRKWPWVRKQYSWIKQVYEFLWNAPLVNIKSESVYINIPWVDKNTLEKTIVSRESTVNQWESEIKRATQARSYWLANCKDQACKDKYLVTEKFILNTQSTLSSLKQNVSVLQEYRKTPTKLASLINKKQERLEQVTCNMESISKITWWWIWENGERFKKWVELYILIKAILKSWQLLANIFIDYDAECHECKNERHDSIGWQFELVSFIIPKIPIIKFPKWPDIILDLHSIKVNIDVTIPEFDFNTRPLVLPLLPNLYLPDSPSWSLKLPNIPVLPVFEIPELPDLPSLPSIELPDLPPPPKLPKIFSQIEWVLNILKLVTKAMCILKKSPFVPEQRAWDQIAFLTERSWYKSFDFIDLTSPQFSYPFIDAVKISTFVNLEFDSDFLVEMAEKTVSPFNTMMSWLNTDWSNVITDSFDEKWIQDKIDKFWDKAQEDVSKELNKTQEDIKLLNFTKIIFAWISHYSDFIKTNSKEIESKDMILALNKELTKKTIVSDSRFDKLREDVKQISNYNYSKEDRLISDLQKQNTDKFETIKSILKTEKKKNADILKTIKAPVSVIQVSNENNSNIEAYKKALKPYNSTFVKSAINLTTQKDIQTEEMKQETLLIKNKFDKVLTSNNKNNLKNTNTKNTCTEANSSDYKYNYKWIYIVEDSISYNLFDYLDELTWKEKTQNIDIWNDKINDLLYSVNWDLYLKKNLLSSKNDEVYVSTNPITVDIEDNKFVNGDVFYESVNNFSESIVSNWNINFNFSSSPNPEINNYRLEYNTIIDKYLNEKNNAYIPLKTDKSIVDAFSNSSNLWLMKESTDYKIHKNIASISYVWLVPWVKLYTKKLQILNSTINENKIAIIWANTYIYSWDNSARIFYINSAWEEKSTILEKKSNIIFPQEIKIHKIEWWELYIATLENIVVEWQNIVDYIWRPLFLDSKIKVYDDSKLDHRSHIDLIYYDDSTYAMDLRKILNYEIYDLWEKSDSYNISLKAVNDYYYARIHSFYNKIISTNSEQILLSPQLTADLNAPELSFWSVIKIPVYQEKIIDLSENIYENSWLDNVEKIVISWIDTDKYEILKSPSKIKIKFKAFSELFSKTLKFTLYDKNNNSTTKDIQFEVYSPNPQIKDFTNNKIFWSLDEELTNEPINIYRIRWWSIKRLQDISNKTKVMTYTWAYDFPISKNNNELYLEVNKKEVLTVLEKTWKIKLLDNSYTINVDDNNGDYYPDINVFNSSKNKVFYENLRINTVNNIVIVDTFKDIKENGLYMDLINKNNYSFYKMSDSISYNPWVIIIYANNDSTKNPLAVIFKDGRIKLDSNYNLEYSELGDNVILNIKSKTWDIVSRVLYKIENTYLIK